MKRPAARLWPLEQCSSPFLPVERQCYRFSQKVYSTQSAALIEGIAAEHLLADKAYDSDALVTQAREPGIQVTIPNKSHRKVRRSFDKDLYKLRHLVENAFLYLKNDGGALQRDTPSILPLS